MGNRSGYSRGQIVGSVQVVMALLLFSVPVVVDSYTDYSVKDITDAGTFLSGVTHLLLTGIYRCDEQKRGE